MSEPERFEVLILGSGQGGKLLAWHMAQAGRRVAHPTVRDAIFAHPTMAEGLGSLFANVPA